MHSALICLPGGHFSPAPGELESLPHGLASAFESSQGAVVLWLANRPIKEALPDPAVAWLQKFSHLWMSAVCRARLPDPRPPEVAAGSHIFPTLLAEVPPFPGAEYLNAEVLAALWEEAGRLLSATCQDHPEGLPGYLKESAGGWHLVGRVTFHLAENPRDPDKPFAFLATYTGSLGAGGQPQHIPLGRALQTFQAAGDEAALDSILTPVRTAAATIPWVHDLLESRRVFKALAWTPAEAWLFIRDLQALEASGLVPRVPDWWKGGRPSRPVVQVTLDEAPSMVGTHAMLQFHIGTTLDGTPLSEEDWQRIRNSPPGLLNLRGQWIEVDSTRLGEVMDHWNKVAAAHAHGGLSFHQGMRYLSGFQPAGSPSNGAAGETRAEDWSQVTAGKGMAKLLEQIRQPEAMPSGLWPVHATLRPYQEKGVAWLTFMRRLGLGACLADDMGLGKTLQVIALLAADVVPDVASPRPSPGEKRQPVLLIVPASLLGNWLAEFARFCPELRVFALHPSRISKAGIDQTMHHPEEILTAHDVVLTTYGFLQRSPALQILTWRAVILDEAQAIKNAGTAQARAVKEIKADWRLALTGTPVENRPGDLWSLFDFLNPGLLGGAASFAAALKRMAESPHGFAPLRRLIQPYILRRMKTDRSVIADLPDKTEMTVFCPLSRKQAILYAKLVEQLKADLRDPLINPIQRKGLVVGYLTKFKQVCNHSSHWSGDGVYAPADSGKFQRLATLCQEIADRQERVLIFTQFREIIDPLSAFLTSIFKRPGLVLHGGTPVKQRQELVAQFQSAHGPPFFLLSVKAGGTGLTLTAASHVIHFDRWWNPAVENQATDRAYRIGQRRNVLVHKFVTAGTLEERIDQMIEAKKMIAGELLGSGEVSEMLLANMDDAALLNLVSLNLDAALQEAAVI